MSFDTFREELGRRIASELGPDFLWRTSKHYIELTAADSAQRILVSVGGGNPPFASLKFVGGVYFPSVHRTWQRLVAEKRFAPFWHASVDTSDLRHMRGLAFHGPGYWEIDTTRSVAPLVALGVNVIRHVVLPFCARYSSIVAARDALCARADGSGDAQCGLHMAWNEFVMAMDCVLDDSAHLRRHRVLLVPSGKDADRLLFERALEMCAARAPQAADDALSHSAASRQEPTASGTSVGDAALPSRSGIAVSRVNLAVILRSFGEVDVATRVASVSDDDYDRIAERALLIAADVRLLDRALALAAVEVIEGVPRALRRKRRTLAD